MRRDSLIWAIGAVWLLLIPARAAVAQSSVTADELLAEINAGRAPVIIDVRTQREYDSGHVPGAVHIPFYAVGFRTENIPAARDQPVVVYCEHGPRAVMAKAALKLAGFEQVRYLEGHMSSWKARGLPMQSVAHHTDE